MANAIVSIDPVWSYQYQDGLKNCIDLDMRVLDTYYGFACQWLLHQHNFFYTHDARVWNTFTLELETEIQKYAIPPSVVVFYLRALYSTLRVALNTIPFKIAKISPYCDDAGLIVAFIVVYNIENKMTILQQG